MNEREKRGRVGSLYWPRCITLKRGVFMSPYFKTCAGMMTGRARLTWLSFLRRIRLSYKTCTVPSTVRVGPCIIYAKLNLGRMVAWLSLKLCFGLGQSETTNLVWRWQARSSVRKRPFYERRNWARERQGLMLFCCTIEMCAWWRPFIYTALYHTAKSIAFQVLLSWPSTRALSSFQCPLPCSLALPIHPDLQRRG